MIKPIVRRRMPQSIAMDGSLVNVREQWLDAEVERLTSMCEDLLDLVIRWNTLEVSILIAEDNTSMRERAANDYRKLQADRTALLEKLLITEKRTIITNS